MLSEIMDEEQDDAEDDAEDDDVPLHWIDCNETDEDLARMQRQIVRNPECLNAKERSHCDATALFRAVSYSHPSCVAFLLQAGADPDLDSPTTSLHISIFGESNTDITKMLLESGASANATKNGNKCAYMVSACRIRATQTVRLLLDYGAMTEDLEYLQCLQADRELYHTFLLDTPLAIAALEGDHDLFRLLLERGALPALRESQHGVTGVVQDAHNVPRLVAHECSASVGVKLRMLRTFHLFGGSLLQPLRSGDTVYVKYSNRNEKLRAIAGKLSGNPRSLMEICRLRIFRTIGKDYLTRMQGLREILPKTVCDFLEFPEDS